MAKIIRFDSFEGIPEGFRARLQQLGTVMPDACGFALGYQSGDELQAVASFSLLGREVLALTGLVCLDETDRAGILHELTNEAWKAFLSSEKGNKYLALVTTEISDWRFLHELSGAVWPSRVQSSAPFLPSLLSRLFKRLQLRQVRRSYCVIDVQALTSRDVPLSAAEVDSDPDSDWWRTWSAGRPVLCLAQRT